MGSPLELLFQNIGTAHFEIEAKAAFEQLMLNVSAKQTG
jgi:hypothetical protein